MKWRVYKDGTLLHIGTDKGGKLQVNDLLAIIGQKGEDISQHISGNKTNGKGQPDMQKSVIQENVPVAKGEGDVPPQNNKQAAPAPSGGGAAMDLSKVEEVVLMPRLSDTMTEGVIASWNKKVGDDVKKGDLLAEIETDKATMELESYKNGKLLYIGAEKGEKIAVNDLLCIIGEEGKVDVQKIVAAAKGGSQPAAQGQQPAQAASATAQESPQQQTLQPNQQTSQSATERVKASPLAKKLAAEKGIDISQVPGTGDNGRITKKDIDSFTPSKAQPAAQETQRPAAPSALQPAVQGQESFTDHNLPKAR